MKTSEILFTLTRTLWSPKKLLKSSVLRNTIVLLGGDASARIISLVALTITVRSLGTASFGVLVLAETYAKLLDRIFTFQSWAALIRFGSMALGEGKPDEFRGYIRLGYTLDCLSAITGAAVAYFVAPAVGGLMGWSDEIVIACRLYSFLILFNATGTSTGILRLTDNFSMLAVQRFTYSLIRIAGVMTVTLYHGGLISFLLAWLLSECAGYIFLNLCAQYVISKNGWGSWWSSTSRLPKKPFITFAIWTNVTSTIDIPVKFLDVFFVSYFVSVDATGIYKIFQQVSHVLKKPTEPLIQVLYPHFSNMNVHSRPRHLLRSALKAVLALALVAFATATVLSASSPIWLPQIFGPVFRKYVLEFTIFMLVQAYAVAVTPLSPLIVARGLVRENFLIQAAANTAFLLCIWILGSKFGFVGVISAIGVHAFISSSLRLLMINKNFNSGDRAV